MNTGEKKATGAIDVLALMISIVSLVIALFALYFSHLRGAHLVVSTGHYVYLQGRPRIGIPVSFLNDGAHAGVINTGSLKLSDGSDSSSFHLALMSPLTEDASNADQRVSTEPSLFSQVVVKAGDIAQGVFWYSPENTDFKFRPDTRYTARLVFAQREVAADGTRLHEEDNCATSLVFYVTKLTVDNASSNLEVIIPVSTDLPTHLR